MKRIIEITCYLGLGLSLLVGCTQTSISEDSYGWFSTEELQRAIEEKPESLLALRDIHSGTGQKVQINVFAIAALGQAYPYHHINAGVYDLGTGEQTNDVEVTVGETPLVRRNARGPVVGAPQLDFEANPEQAKHYARGYFGTETRVHIANAGGEALLDTSLYFPGLLAIEANFQNPEALSIGDQISWEPDPRCSHVLLSLLVLPQSEEESASGELLQKEIENTGSYTVTEGDLAVIAYPKPRRLQFSIAQGAYYVLPSRQGDEVFTLGAFSEVWKMIVETEH